MKYPDETKEWFSGHRCVRLSDTRGLFCKANRGGHCPRHKIAWPFASAPQLSEPESRSGDGSPRVLALCPVQLARSGLALLQSCVVKVSPQLIPARNPL